MKKKRGKYMDITKPKIRQFNLLYYFLICSLITIAIITIYLTDYLTEVTENRMLETKKVLITQTVQKFNDELKTQYILPALKSGQYVSLNEGEFKANLDDFVNRFLEGYNLRQINIIQKDRLILYSTKAGLPGVIGKDSEAFQLALKGEVGSKLMYYPEDMAKTSLEIFVPFEINGEIVGVTMFYQNIKDVLILIDELNKKIQNIMIIGMTGLFLVLFFITLKGHQIIIKQKKSLLELNHNLEEKVKQRTHELYTINQKLKDLALKDGLTGLYNHTEIKTRFKNLISQIQTNQFSCFMMDIDYFKKINDSYGHPFGDEILKQTASTIKNTVRENDITGRYGGEEFIVLLPNTDVIEAQMIAERIREAIETQSFIIEHKKVNITISIGVSTYSGQSFEEMIKEADSALYSAKNNGRNKVKVLNKLVS